MQAGVFKRSLTTTVGAPNPLCSAINLELVPFPAPGAPPRNMISLGQEGRMGSMKEGITDSICEGNKEVISVIIEVEPNLCVAVSANEINR